MFFNNIQKYFMQKNTDVKLIAIFTIIISMIILVSLIFFSLFATLLSSKQVNGFVIFSITLLIAIASALIGMFLGFIFGIPRSHQQMETHLLNAVDNSREITNFSVNTNLEQISDWLTKIIVGVGLVEMNTISQEFYKIVHFLSIGIGLEKTENFVFSLIIACLILGFIFGYLMTRIYLSGAFSRAAAAEDNNEKSDNIRIS